MSAMENDTEFLRGPTKSIRYYSQTTLFSMLLCFGIITNSVMMTVFIRFKSLRIVSNYLLIDLTIVEFLDVLVNVPLFMEFFLFTKKKDLDRQTRWFDMLIHRYFLINDLFTQFSQSVDCLLAIKFGNRYTVHKTASRIIAYIIFKWTAILGLLLLFSIPNYSDGDEMVSDEAYQRLLFGPNQMIWKAVIPSFQLASCLVILTTNFLIMKSRRDVSKRYGMKVFGHGSKNSQRAVNTLFIIMAVQTACKVPAAIYSNVAVDERTENNRWFAFSAYFFIYLSSCLMPVIYFTRTMAFKRALVQLCKHPMSRNAYLDYAAQHALKIHRNGRLMQLVKEEDDEKKAPKDEGLSKSRSTLATNFSSRGSESVGSKFSMSTDLSLDHIDLFKSIADKMMDPEERVLHRKGRETQSDGEMDGEGVDASGVVTVTAQVHTQKEIQSSSRQESTTFGESGSPKSLSKKTDKNDQAKEGIDNPVMLEESCISSEGITPKSPSSGNKQVTNDKDGMHEEGRFSTFKPIKETCISADGSSPKSPSKISGDDQTKEGGGLETENVILEKRSCSVQQFEESCIGAEGDAMPTSSSQGVKENQLEKDDTLITTANERVSCLTEVDSLMKTKSTSKDEIKMTMSQGIFNESFEREEFQETKL